MTKEEIKDTIIEELLLIAPDIEKTEIKENENLQRSLGIDSFDFLKLLTAVYEKTGVEVPEGDYQKVDTLEKMSDYFLKRIS